MQTPENQNQNQIQGTANVTLVAQVEARQAELTRELAGTSHSASTRADIESALATLPTLLTGDLTQLPDMVSRDLIRWLDTSKYLGVHGDAPAPPVPAPAIMPEIKAEDAAQLSSPPPVVAADVSART
jgi:hypothetical protein